MGEFDSQRARPRTELKPRKAHALEADVARLSSQLHEAQTTIAGLEERWETHDSAVCPEDVGCVEYIVILERRIAVFRQERAHQEVERLTGQVSHLSSQLAGMREALEDAASELDGIIHFYRPDGWHAEDLSQARAMLPRLRAALSAAQAPTGDDDASR